tara:strand:+ start:664 stop:885 length:222 start_codon:yes stop_codon:yes gene_type:complete
MARLKNTINEFGDESGSIGERQEKKKKEIAQNISGMPDHVYDSIKRQYSGKNYTIEDKKNVINYYKGKKKKGV